MFKKLCLMLVAALIALGSAGSALAAFADLELIRVYYDRAGSEYATVLGKVKDLAGSGGTFPGGSSHPGTFGSLTTGYAVYFALDRATAQLWSTGNAATAQMITGGPTGITSLKSGTNYVYSLYNTKGGTEYTGLASDLKSYKNKLSATQGNMAGAINNDYRTNTEASINGLLTDGSTEKVIQILYYWSNALTTDAAKKIGVPAATVTTNADGRTVITGPPPSAPTAVSAVAGNAEATVSFNPPVSDGGSTITGYTVTSNPPGHSKTDTASPITVTGLDNGKDYTFTVTATNANGTSPSSAPSNSVKPDAAVATYTITASAPGGNGTITPASASVNAGDVAVLTIASAANYHLATLSDNGADVTAQVSGGSYTITGTAADHAVVATFAIDTRTVTASVTGGNGSLTPASSTVGHGGNVTLTVTPAANHHLATLTDNGTDVVSQVSGGSYTMSGVAADHAVVATFAVDTRTVTASVTGGNGTLAPASSTVDHGGNVTFTITPAANHHLATLTDNGTDVVSQVSGGSYTMSGVAADHAVVATFAIDTRTVTASVTGGNGTLTPASSTVNHGDSVTATITPAENYHLATLTDNGADVISQVAGGWYTITGVAADHALVATFAINGHTVTPSVGVGTGHGSIAADTPQTVGHGGAVTFTLTPEPAYTATVTGTCGGTLAVNSYTTLPIVDDCTVIANFSKNNYTVIASAGANGSVSPAVQLVAEGALATITITPSTGYKIASVTGTCGGTLTGNTFITTAVNGNCTVEAGFSIKTSTVAASVTGGNGTVTPESSTVNYGGTSVLVVTPAANHHLATLTDNGANVTAAVSGGSYTLTGVTADHTIIATFAVNTRAITASVASGNGAITPASSTVNEGSSATLTIAPAVGYHLATVTDNGIDVTTQANAGSYTIGAISTDHVVIAAFAIDTKSVTATVGAGNGTITPGSSTVNYGSNLTLAVTPAAHHRLVSLTDNGVDVAASVNAGSYTITGVTTDHAVTATFALETREVAATVSGGNGAITPASSTVNYGGSATVTVTPAANHHLASLTSNGIDVTALVSGGSYTVTGVSENHNLVATFAIDTRSVTAENSGNGAITPASSVINYGGSATLAVTPTAGYRLERLTDNGADVTGSVNNGGYTIANIRENHAVVATFRGITFTVAPTAGANGGISPATQQSVDAGKSFSFKVIPAPGYQIASVTGCGGALSGETYTTAGISGSCSVSATFVAVPALRGDLNLNKEIDIADAQMALRIAVGLMTATAADMAAGDVAPIVDVKSVLDGTWVGKSAPDGRLDVADAIALLRRSVKLISW